MSQIKYIRPLVNHREIARRIDVHPNTVSNYMRGKFTVGSSDIMAKILKVGKDMILEIKVKLEAVDAK